MPQNRAAREKPNTYRHNLHVLSQLERQDDRGHEQQPRHAHRDPSAIDLLREADHTLRALLASPNKKPAPSQEKRYKNQNLPERNS